MDKKKIIIVIIVVAISTVAISWLLFSPFESTKMEKNIEKANKIMENIEWKHFFRNGCADGSPWGFQYGEVRNKNLSIKLITKDKGAWEICGTEKKVLPANSEFDRSDLVSKQKMIELVTAISRDRDTYAEKLIIPQAIRLLYSPYKEKRLMTLRWEKLNLSMFDKIKNLPSKNSSGSSPYETGRKIATIIKESKNKNTLNKTKIIMANYIDLYDAWLKGNIQNKLADAAKIKFGGLKNGEASWEVMETLIFVRARQAVMDIINGTTKQNPEYVQIIATISKELLKRDKKMFSILQTSFDRKIWTWNPAYKQNIGDVIGLTSFLYLAKQEYTSPTLRTDVKLTEYEMEVEERFIDALLQKVKQQAISIKGAADGIKAVKKAVVNAGFTVDMFECLKIVRGSAEITELTTLLDTHINSLIKDGIIRSKKELQTEVNNITKTFDLKDQKIIFPEGALNKIMLGLEK